MKKLILAMALGVACVSAYAQGTMTFGVGSGCVFYVTDSNGTKLTGNAFAADIYWGAGTVTDSSTLTAVGQPANFGAGGYIAGTQRTFATAATGATITIQVRAWDTADGNSYSAVLNSGSATAQVGSSILTQIVLGGPPGIPPYATGLNTHNFSLAPVPEPGTLALAGLGAAAMFIFRRRR